jgi:hypothetical protein
VSFGVVGDFTSVVVAKSGSGAVVGSAGCSGGISADGSKKRKDSDTCILVIRSSASKRQKQM